MSRLQLVATTGGLTAVAAGLELHGFYVKVGRGHNWEQTVEESGVPAEQIAKALKSDGFNKGNAHSPVVAIERAAAFARAAAAAERNRQPEYGWQAATVIRKPHGHCCDLDATCTEQHAFRVIRPDGQPTLLCCWHYLKDAPKPAGDLYRAAMHDDRDATAAWADEMALQFQRLPVMPSLEVEL